MKRLRWEMLLIPLYSIKVLFTVAVLSGREMTCLAVPTFLYCAAQAYADEPNIFWFYLQMTIIMLWIMIPIIAFIGIWVRKLRFVSVLLFTVVNFFDLVISFFIADLSLMLMFVIVSCISVGVCSIVLWHMIRQRTIRNKIIV